MSHNPLDKIQALDAIEKEIITCVQSAGQALLELGKEKTSQKAAENNTQQFLKSLNIIETKLSEQINYLTQVSTGQPHEGSGYASAKVLQMAWHRIQHARSRVRELDESKNKYLQATTRQQQQQQQHQQQPQAQQNSQSQLQQPGTPSVQSPAPAQSSQSIPQGASTPTANESPATNTPPSQPPSNQSQ